MLFFILGRNLALERVARSLFSKWESGSEISTKPVTNHNTNKKNIIFTKKIVNDEYDTG